MKLGGFQNLIGTRAAMLLLACFASVSVFAQSGPSALNISGGLYNSSGQPIVQNHVNFKLEILDKNSSCVLYRELHTGEDLSNTKGGFSLLVGRGSSIQNLISGGTSALTAQVFENPGTPQSFSGCGGVTMSSGDERMIRVYYDLGSGYTAMAPDVPIVSSAYAMVAESLQGKHASDFLQVNGTATGSLNQGNADYAFSLTNWPKLKNLLDGTSTQYMSGSPTVPVNLNGQRLTNLASPATTSDAVTKGYADTNIGGKTADVSGIGPAIGDGKTLVWDATAGKWVTGTPSATDNTKLPLAGGTMSGAITMGGFDLAATGHITMSAQKALTLGNFTDAQETTLVSGLTAANKGASWYNTDHSVYKIWDGTHVVQQAWLDAITTKLSAAWFPATTVVAGSYGTSGVTVPNFTVGADGRLTAAGETVISGVAPGGTAAGDLTGSYPAPLIATNAVTNAKINNGAITTGKLSSTIAAAGGQVLLTDSIDPNKIVYFSCNANEIMKWTIATGWACTTVASLSPVTSVAGKSGAVTLNAGDITGLGQAALLDYGTAAAQLVQLDGTGHILPQLLPASSGTITGVTAGSHLLGGGTTGVVTLNVDTGVSAGQVVALNGTAQLPPVDGSLLTSVNAVKLQSRSVSATAPGGGQVLGYNSSLSVWEPMSGAVGSVTSVTAGPGLVGGPITSSGSLYVDMGTTAGKIVQLNGSAALPAIDGSLLRFVNAIKLQSYDVSAVAPTPNQVLKWNGSTNVWEGQADVNSGGTVTYIQTSTGLTGGPVSATGTIAVDVGSAASKVVWENASAQIAQQAGAVGAPAYTFSGDTATGLYAPGVGVVSLATLGTARFTVNGQGNVGVGTTSPAAGLDIATTGTGSSFIIVPRDTTANRPVTAASVNGSIRYNTNNNALESFVNGSWQNIAVGAGVGTMSYLGTGTGLTGGPVTSTGTVAVDVGSAPSKIVWENASAQIAQQAGAVGAPAYTFSGDTSTGLYSSGVGSTALATLGTARLTVTNTGNVGIGTTSPGNNLSIDGTDGDIGVTIRNKSSTADRFPGVIVRNYLGATNGFATMDLGTFGGTSGVTTATPASKVVGAFVFKAYDGASSQPIAQIKTSTGSSFASGDNEGILSFETNDGASGTTSEKMRITQTGNVGIGTTNPAALLDVSGTGAYSAMIVPRDITANRPGTPVNGMIRYNANTNLFEFFQNNAWVNYGTGAGGGGDFKADGSVAMTGDFQASDGTATAPAITFASDPDTGLYHTAANSIGFATGGSLVFQINNGLLTSSTLHAPMINTAGITAASPGYAFNGDANNGMFWAGSDTLGFTTNGTERVRIDSSGNVGIGTTNPDALLDVSGTGAFSAMIVPRDITANRPGTPVNGMIRYNTNNNAFEFFQNNAWVAYGTSGAGGGGVSYVGVSTGLIGGPISATGTLAVDVGSAAGKIVWENASAQIAQQAGTVGAPAYTFSGDADTGFYSAGAGTASLATNGTARFTVDSLGNVGIGTTTPTQLLEVRSGGSRDSIVKSAASTGTNKNGFEIQNDWVNPVPNAALYVYPNTYVGNNPFGEAISGHTTVLAGDMATNGTFKIGSVSTSTDLMLYSGSLPRLTIKGTGNVGIGTTSPRGVLDLAGTGTGSSVVVVPRDSTANRPAVAASINGMMRYSTDGNVFEFFQNGSWVNYGTTGTPASVSFPLLASPGTTGPGTPSYSFNGDSDTGFFSAGVGTASFATNGTTRLTIDSVGNVGIGLAAPTQALDVVGSLNTSVSLISPLMTTSLGTNLNINPGAAATATSTGNTVTIASGAGGATSGASGLLTLAGAAGATSTAVGGGVTVRAGGGGSNANGGATIIQSGNSGGTGSGGALSILSGTGNGGAGGSGGAISIISGNAAGTGTGGAILVSAGTGGTGSAVGSAVTIKAGTGSTTGAGGVVTMSGGAGGLTSGNGGAVNLNGGVPIAGAGGSVNLTAAAGVGTNQNGGNIVLVSGAATGTGVPGTIQMTGNVGVGTTTPAGVLDLMATGTGSSTLIVPRDTTAGRPAVAASVNGMLRYNTNGNAFEFFQNGSWVTYGTSGGGSTSFPLLASPIGSPSAPAYSFTGDSDTGWYSSGVGTAALATNGTARLTVDSLGNLGVGTTAPISKLEVAGSTVVNGSLAVGGSFAPGARLHIGRTVYTTDNDLYFGTVTGNDAKIYQPASSDDLRIWSATPGDMMTFKNDGRVGIGTTAPRGILDITATGTGSSVLVVPRDTTAGRPAIAASVNGMMRYNTNGNAFEFFQNGSWVTYGTTGSGSVSFPLLASPGTTPPGAPSYSFTGSTNTGLFSPAVGNLALTTLGTTALTVDGSGNIGIGTTAPGWNLDLVKNGNTDNGIGITNTSTGGNATIGVWLANGGGTHGWLKLGGTSNSSVHTADRVQLGSVTGVSIAAGGANADIRFYTTGAYNEVMRIATSGNVGIGTGAPQGALDLTATGTGSSVLIVPRDTTAGRPAIAASVNGMIRYNTNLNYFEAFENNSWKQMITPAGSGTVAFPLLSTTSGSAALPAYAFSADPDTGMYQPAVGKLAFTTNGTARLTIRNSGADSMLDFGNSDIINASAGTMTVETQGAGFKLKYAGNDRITVDNSIDVMALNDLTLGDNGGTTMTLAGNRVGIGTVTPLGILDLTGTGTGSSVLVVPRDTTAGRPAIAASVNGMMRYNTNGNAFEFFQNGSWVTYGTSGSGGSVSFPLLASPIGSPSAPAYSFSGDADTGWYSSGAGTAALATNGTARMTVDSSGNVGIGTSSPTVSLNVVSAAASDSVIVKNTNASGFSDINIQDSAGTTQMEIGYGNASAVPSAFRTPYVYSTSSLSFFLNASTTTPSVVFNSSGNVGIGTTTPAAILDLTATGTGSSALIVPRDTTAGRPAVAASVNGMLRYNTNGNAFEFFQNGSWVTYGTSGSGGSVTFPLLASPIGSPAAPAYSFTGDSATGFYSAGAGTASFATNGTARLTIDGTGEVGIGTTSPSAPLHVAKSNVTPVRIDRTDINPTAELNVLTLYRSNSDTTLPGIGFGEDLAFNLEGWTNNSSATAAAIKVKWEQSQSNDTTDRNGTMIFSTSSSGTLNDRMYLTSGGNLGLGAVPAGSIRLDATGQIRAIASTINQGYQLSNGTNTIAQLNGSQTGNEGGTLILADSGVTRTLISGTNSAPSYFSGKVAVGSTTATSSMLTITGGMQVNSTAGWPTTGTGLTLLYEGTASQIQSSTRGAPSTMLPLVLTGSTYTVGTALGTASPVARMTIDSSGNMGIGTTTPAAILDLTATGTGSSALIVPRDTTAGRPAIAASVNGMIRYNTNNNAFEFFQSGAWVTYGTGGSGGGVSWPLTASPNTSSAGAPQYTFGGSLTTGVFSPGTTTLAFATNGSERVRIDAAGNVGIGTSSPSSLLTANGMIESKSGGIKFPDGSVQISAATGNGSITPALRAGWPDAIICNVTSPNWGTRYLYLADDYTPSSTVEYQDISGGVQVAYNYDKSFNSYSGSYVTTDCGISVTSIASAGRAVYFSTSIWSVSGATISNMTGKVGIGTTTPAAILDLTATGTGSSALIVPRDTTAGRPAIAASVNGMIRYNTNNNAFEFFQNNAWVSYSTGAGGSVSWPLLASPGTTPPSAPSYSFNSDTSTGLFSPGAGLASLVSAGTTALTAKGATVGIGTNSPNYNFSTTKLDVFSTDSSVNKITVENSLTTSTDRYPGMIMANYMGATTFGGFPVLQFFNARGSMSSPTAPNSGDALGVIEFHGVGGNGGSYIRSSATQNWTNNSAEGSNILFATSTNGSASPLVRMAIDNNGNVGVGTSAPAAILDLTATGTGSSALIVPRDTTAGRPAVAASVNGMLRYNTNGNAFEFFQNGSWVTYGTSGSGGSPAGANTQIQFNNSGAFGASANMAWDNTNNSLTLSKNNNAAGGGLILQSTATNGYSEIAVKDSSGTSTGWFGYGNASAAAHANSVYMEAAASRNLEFTTNANVRMTIDGTGNVGIGTTAGTNAKLYVEGQVRSGFLAHSSLNTNWASGNIQTTSVAAGTLTFTSGSMYDGASYILVLTSAGTFTLSTAGDVTTWRCLPACASNQIVATGHTVLTIFKAGTTGYVSWAAGY